jgi:hypothetical protein
VRLHQPLQSEQVAVEDVPTILTQMHGYAVSTCLLGNQCSMNRIRMAATTGLTHRTNMVNVHA